MSNHEVAGYKEVVHRTAWVKFELADDTSTFLVAWTTTPWNLPANMALAVNPDLDYKDLSLSRTTEDDLSLATWTSCWHHQRQGVGGTEILHPLFGDRVGVVVRRRLRESGEEWYRPHRSRFWSG